MTRVSCFYQKLFEEILLSYSTDYARCGVGITLLVSSIRYYDKIEVITYMVKEQKCRKNINELHQMKH